MTYKEISEKYGITVSTLTRRAFVLKLKPYYVNRNVVFSAADIEALVTYKPPERKKKNKNIEKFRIIEFYQKYKSARKVSHILNIYRDFVIEILKEVHETGYITIDSKINFEN